MLANSNINIALDIIFLSFNNVNIEFAEVRKLILKSYTTTETLPITSWVEIINKKEFAKAVIFNNFETFVVYISILKITELLFHLF